MQLSHCHANGMLEYVSMSGPEHANLGYEHVAAIVKAQSCSILQVGVVFTCVEHVAAKHKVACKH